MTKRMKTTFLTAALALGLALPAAAIDRVVLEDGKVYEGEIVAKTDTYVQIRVDHGGMATTHTFWMGSVKSIEEDASVEAKTESESAKPTKGSATPAAKPASKDAATAPEQGVILLPLTGMVGLELRHEEIEEVAEEADRIRKETGVSPIIVLEIESGGGLMTEMYDIHETLSEIKKRHRVVAWIKQAISAAAATAFHCDEIYFMTEGNMGAMTGFNGGTGQSLQGVALAQWLVDASQWAEQGGRPGAIARAMIDETVLLSYDKDPVTGKVTWYESLEGEYDLSDATSNLAFNSSNAVHSGFADGVADTTSELAKLLDLQEWHEVSDVGREAWEDWTTTVERAQVEIPRIFGRFQIVQSSPAADALEKIGRQIKLLEDLRRWMVRAPNVAMMAGVPYTLDDIDRMLKELRKQASDLRRRGG